MKTKLISSIAIVLISMAIVSFLNGNDSSELSDVQLSNIEALSGDGEGSDESNYGPAKEVKCVNGKQHKKICMCEPGYPPCTETDCY